VAEVQLSPKARADFVEIRLYSNAEFGGDVADAYFLGFDEVFDLLERHPHVGQAQPKYGKGIRCIVHRNHRLFYTVVGERVIIIRIIHHAQDAQRALN
jgi:toxin ParE1/3/4